MITVTHKNWIYWGDKMDFNILLFNDFETLDIFGPIEIFASKIDHKINYYSLNGGVIVSRQGAKIITDKISNADKKGVLVLPGGMATRKLVEDNEFLKILKDIADSAEYCISICTGSAVFAKAGLLDGKKATSNKRALDWVKTMSDKTEWIDKARWVVSEKYYTSSGVSAGIDMALGFMADLYGIEVAKRIAQGIEYVWNSDKDKDEFYLGSK